MVERERSPQVALPEYWIIDVGRMQTLVLLDPRPEGYGRVDPVAGKETVRARAPEVALFAMRLAELN